jgi:hypothetical protein
MLAKRVVTVKSSRYIKKMMPTKPIWTPHLILWSDCLTIFEFISKLLKWVVEAFEPPSSAGLGFAWLGFWMTELVNARPCPWLLAVSTNLSETPLKPEP